MTYKITELVVGDWSHDGHGQTEKFLVRHPEEIDLEKAYALGTKIVGGDIEDYCDGYEDSNINALLLKNIILKNSELGLALLDDDGLPVCCLHDYLDPARPVKVSLKSMEEFGDVMLLEMADEALRNDTVEIETDAYAALWIAVANIGMYAKGLGVHGIIEFAKKENRPQVKIGGSGLFWI